jgi:di/tricarboxylate transporter
LTPQITTVLGIILLSVSLFVTGLLPMELVALLVLVSLALSGLLTPAEALSGFSNPAVVTVWAVFVMSGGLSRTGVASRLGRQVLRLAGTGEARLLLVIMLAAAAMSAFMNNVGVAALLLPVVVDIARRTGRPPSRLLMPLAFGALLGGLNTLIGTPPNILVSDALSEQGLSSFQLFDFALVGLPITLAGVAYMILVGRHLLPEHDLVKEALPGSEDRTLHELYSLEERLFLLRVPEHSPLAGRNLAASRLGVALGLNVVAIMRNHQTLLAPRPSSVLQPEDRLLVQGRLDQLTGLGQRDLLIREGPVEVDRLISSEIGIAEVQLIPDSDLVGKTLLQNGFRQRFGVNVLAIRRDGAVRRSNLNNLPLQANDTMLIQGPWAALDVLHSSPDWGLVRSMPGPEVTALYHLSERLIALHVPADSVLVGKSLAEGRLGEAFGLTVLGIERGDATHWVPAAEEQLLAGDILLVEGRPADLETLRGLQGLQIEHELPSDLDTLESGEVGLAEVVLSPHTTLVRKTLHELQFREKYELTVLAIWREGRAYRSKLRDMTLRLGDALLVYGPREKLRMLGSEPDFLVLTEESQQLPRFERAPWAVAVMAGVLVPVMVGWTPISIAAVAGAAMMVVTGCLTMQEAYRYIEWRAVFLIAGMLPLGIAMEQTGAARLLAEGLVTTLGGWGPSAVTAGLFIVGTAATQVMPTPAIAVLLMPIALRIAGELAVSPYALAMTVAVASTTCFHSPVSHPANVLIMGPGGYRFTDYIRVGLPLTLVVLVVHLLVLPVFWPY